MPVLNSGETGIHYVRRGRGGAGTALVFVHGALCALDDWNAQLDHFAPRHEVVALDLHGHGASARGAERIGVRFFARDVVALCDALGLDQVVLVGHSMGCRVLLETWRIAPGRVAGLVFVDGAYLVPALHGDKPDVQRATEARIASERAAAAYVDVEPAERARHGFAQMFFDPRFNAARDAIVKRAMALPPHVARTLMPDFAAWDVLHLERVLATVTVPVLAIACTFMNSQRERVSLQPGIVTPWLQALAAYTPQAEVRRVHGAGHFPMIEDPDGVNREIAVFVARHGLG